MLEKIDQIERERENMNTFIVFFGYVAGGLILLNTLATLGQGTSAIHQIYEILA